MQALYDRKMLRRNLYVMIPQTLLTTGCACIVLLLTDSIARVMLLCPLSLTALLSGIVSLHAIGRLRRGTAFVVTEDAICFGKKRVLLDEIQSVRVSAQLRPVIGRRMTHAEMERLAMLPPLTGLPGSILIRTLERRYVFTELQDVMQLFSILTLLDLDVRAFYVLESSVVSYVYFLIAAQNESRALTQDG
jgi:hypothetical protein